MTEASSTDKTPTGLILAGGRARRLAGQDKGLVLAGGRPLIAYAIDAMRQVTPQILISANRNTDRYTGYGCRILPDTLADYPGPLAGMLAALETMQTDWLLVMPCDAPLAEAALLRRLLEARGEDGAPACVARDAVRLQPTFCLLHRDTAAALREFLTRGQRRAQAWLQALQPVVVDCSDHPEWFYNINTPEDLAQLDSRLPRPHD